MSEPTKGPFEVRWRERDLGDGDLTSVCRYQEALEWHRRMSADPDITQVAIFPWCLSPRGIAAMGLRELRLAVDGHLTSCPCLVCQTGVAKVADYASRDGWEAIFCNVEKGECGA